MALTRDEAITVAIEHVRGEGEKEWDQRDWVSPCGTAFCVAGWLAVKQGYQPIIDSNQCRAPDERRHSTPIIGRRALGLEAHEASWLFDSDRTQDEILDALDGLRNDISILETIWSL